MKKFNKKIVKKILFIKSGAIGDVIMTTPLIRTVRNEFPEAEIQYCTGNWSKGVLENNKNIDKIIPFEEKIIFKKNIFKLLKLAKSLSKEKFDLCFVLDWSYLAGLFAAMCAPSAIRIGFNRNSEGFAHSIRVPYGDKKHDSQY
ncbi:MAG: lipopolysaccharide heptosyltransferase II, partial [Nanoarchaeota archaeon]|nr:lipopolysaccharide heptosyltransferase II [Nanoarchaeota archaeon]